MEGAKQLTCPNAPPEPGAAIIGVVQASGQIAYVSPSIPLTRDLVMSFQAKHIEVENRLRVAGPCSAADCIQWGQGRCSLVDKVVADVRQPLALPSHGLPRCGIRQTCRWFVQHNVRACHACPEVVRKPAQLYGRSAE
ncbi:MAG: hypothetical protein Q7V20_20350 [Aquabacterium sp.]|uniref:hypothetical protein n=1 Tax=Aquabacterium sp. TaxID=1872578 RepID=UPI002715A6C7|nr:hypothetical protein [Aquabacterium sp.]MDO9005801.1 hypothetical protein [Aquabacterium sp.]